MPFVAWGRSGSDAGVDVGLGTEDEEVTTAGESEGSDDVVTRTAVDVVAGTAGGRGGYRYCGGSLRWW